MDLRKITFSYIPETISLLNLVTPSEWAGFDDSVSALAEKLYRFGNKQTLEVEVQVQDLISDLPLGYDLFLPKFREKGRVRVVNRSSGRVFEFRVCFISHPRYVTSDLDPSELNRA